MLQNNFMSFFRPVNYFNSFNNYFSGISIFNRNYQNNTYSGTYRQPVHFAPAVKTSSAKTIFGAKYNEQKGKTLAKNIIEGLPDVPPENPPLCARYVKKAIQKSGLGPYVNGDGEYCKYILRANPNFQQVNVKGKDFDKLPEGTAIVYDANDKYTDDNGGTHKVSKYGHVLIVLKGGKAASDRMHDYIPKSDRAYVFIPV